MHVLIAGAGQQGIPLAFGLNKLGITVSAVDPNPSNLAELPKKLDSIEAVPTLLNTLYETLDDVKRVDDKFDAVMSAAPYHQNRKIADFAYENGIRYCDLGGDPDTTNYIQQQARKHNGVAFTDLGLAPGLGNIVAEMLFLEVEEQVTDVHIRVGGLPINPEGYLNYARTWSTAGLRNEYSGACSALKDGENVHPQAMTGLEEFTFPGIGTMEAFHTKGAIVATIRSMQPRGVKNVDYKTVRHTGHAAAIRFLREECNLNDEDFDNALESACPLTHKDRVLIMVTVNNLRWSAIDTADKDFTSMQKMTAFPAASVVALVAEGYFDDLHVPAYKDIPFDRFKENYNKIGRMPMLDKGKLI